MWCCEILKYLFIWIHMLISCSRSERESASSLLWVSLCRWMMCVGWWWKKTTVAGGAPDGMVLWLGGKMETRLSGGESSQGWDDLFIGLEGGSRTVRGGWPVAVVWIQCFSSSSRGDVTGWSVAKRWSGGSELVLALWEGIMARCGSMAMSNRGEAAPGRGKGGDDVSWADANLTGPKNKENSHSWSSYYKWTVKT
jgi:hypothetical protein